VVFGLLHGNLEQIPFAMLLGLYLGFVRVKTESILPAVLLHFLNNFFSVGMSFLYDKLGHTAQGIAYPLYYLVLTAFGFIGILMLKNENTDFFKFEKQESALSDGKKITTFLFAPLMIIVLAVVVIESFFVYV
jgi:membrane protease YdiL (CAAX protease family)